MDDTPFLAQVEEFFLAQVKQGLSLRPADIEVARDWEARTVPIEAVRRGIVMGIKAFEARADPRGGLPRSLGYYRHFVEKEFEAHRRALALGLTFRRGPVQDGPAQVIESAVAALEASMDVIPPAARPAVANAIRLLHSFDGSRSITMVVRDVDETILQAVVSASTPEARADIEARVAEVAEDASRRGLGRVAAKDMEAAALRKAVADVTGFRSPLEGVL